MVLSGIIRHLRALVFTLKKAQCRPPIAIFRAAGLEPEISMPIRYLPTLCFIFQIAVHASEPAFILMILAAAWSAIARRLTMTVIQDLIRWMSLWIWVHLNPNF